jgi:SAM-dependent methyltransferase
MKYFDNIAPSYDQVRGKEILPAVISSVSSIARRGETVIDIATGTGLFSVPLSERGYRVIGVDANPLMLAEARHKAAQLGADYHTARAAAEHLPFQTDSVPVMLSTNAIHHFDIRFHLAEVQRVLKPGGSYIIFTRFAEQNARSIWGRLFPDFTVKEDRLYSAQDFNRLDREFPDLVLDEMEELAFIKPFSRHRLLKTARQRKYSTFARYSDDEFHLALRVFERRLQNWQEEHYTAEISRLVFRAQ